MTFLQHSMLPPPHPSTSLLSLLKFRDPVGSWFAFNFSGCSPFSVSSPLPPSLPYFPWLLRIVWVPVFCPLLALICILSLGDSSEFSVSTTLTCVFTSSLDLSPCHLFLEVAQKSPTWQSKADLISSHSQPYSPFLISSNSTLPTELLKWVSSLILPPFTQFSDLLNAISSVTL